MKIYCLLIFVALALAAEAMLPGLGGLRDLGYKFINKRCQHHSDCVEPGITGSTLCCDKFFNLCKDCRECSSDQDCHWLYGDPSERCECEGGWCIDCRRPHH